MSETSSGRGLQIVAIVAAVVATDQISKRVVVRALGAGAERDEVELIGDVVRLEYSQNTGIAFGFLSGAGALLTVAVVVLTAAVAVHAWRGREGSGSGRAGMALMLGGAIGNLVDRVRLGYVVDFVSVGSWPTFNVADVAISIGVVVLAATLFRPGPVPAPVVRRPGLGDHAVSSRDRGPSVGHHG